MLHAYERGLDVAMRWRLTTLVIFFATLGLSVYLFVIIPKGFFPQQDIGLITATSEAAQDISFAEMKRREEALGAIAQADPAVASMAMVIGGNGRAGNNGSVYMTLKPLSERTPPPNKSSPACVPNLKRSRGPACICRPRRTCGSAADRRGRSSNSHCRMPILTNSTNGRPRSWPRCRRCRSCVTSPLTSRVKEPRYSCKSTETPPRAMASSRN